MSFFFFDWVANWRLVYFSLCNFLKLEKTLDVMKIMMSKQSDEGVRGVREWVRVEHTSKKEEKNFLIK